VQGVDIKIRHPNRPPAAAAANVKIHPDPAIAKPTLRGMYLA